MSRWLTGFAERLYGMAWEGKRRIYAAGWATSKRVPSRVVSIGNLTVGGTGKTTLTLHLARVTEAQGLKAAVVCRRYRPGPRGRGDEEELYLSALGESRVFAGRSKRDLALRASSRNALLLVDDGFSHWGLERDLDLVLIDARDPWGGGRLLPAGRLREPRRALQRADIVVISRLERDEDPEPRMNEARRYAPAALVAAGRHRIGGVRHWDGVPVAACGPARVVTATGHPAAVERSAREAGFSNTRLAAYPDHHWFSEGEARRELDAARAENAMVILTAKDAVRWPHRMVDARIGVLEVEWAWVSGGEAVERRVCGG
jgi:tetraacyldisaccharide 4'-kinase